MHSEEQKYDQKNIRRRVYDALNVLLAMNIICKRKKVRYRLGWFTGREGSFLVSHCKKETIQELVVQLVAYKSLVWKNREMERLNTRPPENSVLYLPFVIINTSKGTTVDCAVSGDRSEFLFQFDQTFEVYDDFEVRCILSIVMTHLCVFLANLIFAKLGLWAGSNHDFLFLLLAHYTLRHRDFDYGLTLTEVQCQFVLPGSIPLAGDS
ncbi:unnamed protein product [Angiostrongylus costaricensis]|uniref:DP domain-containing protein n=1 Tax=Angiostrongylus costaricensis TaxID=334426 RepID=A0A0R3PML3_ANGCS|nr:unnamed protein product [Angiostrongylus costaricensis]